MTSGSLAGGGCVVNADSYPNTLSNRGVGGGQLVRRGRGDFPDRVRAIAGQVGLAEHGTADARVILGLGRGADHDRRDTNAARGRRKPDVEIFDAVPVDVDAPVGGG